MLFMGNRPSGCPHPCKMPRASSVVVSLIIQSRFAPFSPPNFLFLVRFMMIFWCPRSSFSNVPPFSWEFRRTFMDVSHNQVGGFRRRVSYGIFSLSMKTAFLVVVNLFFNPNSHPGELERRLMIQLRHFFVAVYDIISPSDPATRLSKVWVAGVCGIWHYYSHPKSNNAKFSWLNNAIVVDRSILTMAKIHFEDVHRNYLQWVSCTLGAFSVGDHQQLSFWP